MKCKPNDDPTLMVELLSAHLLELDALVGAAARIVETSLRAPNARSRHQLGTLLFLSNAV
jgi:hypothetical protein